MAAAQPQTEFTTTKVVPSFAKDSDPTLGSSNTVESGGVYNAIEKKEDKLATLPNDVFDIQDVKGRSSYRVHEDGSIDIAKFGTLTENYISSLLGNSRIYGKKISIMGDSISTPTGSATPELVYPEQWYNQLVVNHNCTVHVNAEAGSTITEGFQGTAMSNVTRMDDMDSAFIPDDIMIFGGINDFLQDVPLGVVTDTVNTTFFGALDVMYKYLLAQNNGTNVWHILPLHTLHAQAGGLIPEYNGVHYLTEYIEAIRVKSAQYGVRIIDTFNNSGITVWKVDDISNDGIHINASGHLKVASTVVSEYNLKGN